MAESPLKIAGSADERIPLVDTILAELEQRGHVVACCGPAVGEEAD